MDQLPADFQAFRDIASPCKRSNLLTFGTRFGTRFFATGRLGAGVISRTEARGGFAARRLAFLDRHKVHSTRSVEACSVAIDASSGMTSSRCLRVTHSSFPSRVCVRRGERSERLEGDATSLARPRI